MTKTEIIKFGQSQIEMIKAAVIGKRVTPEKFKGVCAVTASEQEPEESEKGTLSLEKEKEPRAVDAFVYAGYRRAAVDQLGAFLTYGLYIRLLHHFVDEKGGTALEDKRNLDGVTAAVSACMGERTVTYKEEMHADPDAICVDLCGFMDAMNVKDFFWITTGYGEGDEMHPYFTAFLDVWAIIQDGTTALAAALEETKRTDEREAFAARIDQHIRQAAIRLVGEPPEGTDSYGGDYHFQFGEAIPDPLDDEPTDEKPTAQEAFGDSAAILDALSGQLTFFDGEETQPEPIPAASLSEKAKRAAGLKSASVELIKTAGRHPEGVLYPVDKVNSNVWKMLERQTGAQIRFHCEDKKNSSKEAIVLYSIDFSQLDDISISKRLTGFDKLVYIIVGALLDAGNEVITYRGIYSTMGNNGAPGTRDLERIEKSLEKMRGAQIFVDNENEAQSQKRRAHFTYSGSLLPWEAIRAEVNGKLIDAAVRPLREPPLLTFAKERKQITKLPLAALAAPVSKTEQTLDIQDYLIERVARAKTAGSQKILFKTLFEKTNIEEKKQKQRAKVKIRAILEQFKKAKLIKDFAESPDGVTISANT